MSNIIRLFTIYLSIVLTCLSSAGFQALDSSKQSGELLECQKRVAMEWAHMKGLENPDNFITKLAEDRYPYLSDYDRHFLTKRPLVAPALLTVRDSSKQFSDMVCNPHYQDHKQTNALVHFMMSVAAVVTMGENTACEFTTGHELLKQQQDTLLAKDQRSVAHLSNSMDLLNNKAGLLFAKEHLATSKNCLRELKMNRESEGSLSTVELPTEVKGACFEVMRIIKSDDKYKLHYWRDPANSNLGDCYDSFSGGSNPSFVPPRYHSRQYREAVNRQLPRGGLIGNGIN